MMPCDFMMGINCFLMFIFSIISLNYVGFKVLSYNKGMSMQTKDLVIELDEDMCAIDHIELDKIEDCIRDSEAAWVYLHEGGLMSFMEGIGRYDEHVSLQFVNT